MAQSNTDTVKRNLKRIVKGMNPLHNLGMKLLAFLIALVALYFVAGQLLVEEIEVPLYITIPDEFASIEPVLETATVRVLSSGTILGSLDSKQIYFDFSGLDFEKGEMFINLDEYLKSPPGVEIAIINPARIRLTIDDKITREVPVEASYSGKPPVNYEYLKHEIMPGAVKIEGAKRIVEAIAQLQTTPISLTNRTDSFTVDAQLELENLNVTPVNNEPILVSTVIARSPRTLRVYRVPINAVSPPEAFTFNPTKVSATFTCDSEKVKSISRDDIVLQIDLSGNKPLNREFKEEILLEIKRQEIKDYCKFRYLSQRKVDVLISKIGNRE